MFSDGGFKHFLKVFTSIFFWETIQFDGKKKNLQKCIGRGYVTVFSRVVFFVSIEHFFKGHSLYLLELGSLL